MIADDGIIRMSPAQVDALDELEARFPATHFLLLDQAAYSRAVLVEHEDLRSAGEFWLAANGRTLTTNTRKESRCTP